MNAREFYRAVVNMRQWQRECDKLNSARNRSFRTEAERIVDAEIKRVEQIQQQQADNQQLKIL